MVGMFVSSKTGRDKNRIYIIYKETDEYVYLVDGIFRYPENPKKKKWKHIQPITKTYNENIVYKLQNGLPVRNEEFKRAIKLYAGGISCQRQM